MPKENPKKTEKKGSFINLFIQQSEENIQEEKIVNEPINPIDDNPVVSNKTIVNTLRKAMQEKALPGFDYFKFKSSLDKLPNSITDEATRYQIVFAMVSTMNISIDVLTSSISHYLNVIKEEKTEFEETISDKQKEVDNKLSEISETEKSIQTKTEQIKLLTDEIASLNKEHLDKGQEFNSLKTKIDLVRNEFDASVEIVASELKSDLFKIKKYLGGK